MKKVILFFCILFNLGMAVVVGEFNRYVINDTGVFWNGKKIEGVDMQTFNQFAFRFIQYAKDKNTVYYKGEVIKNADVETFEIFLNFDYSKDKNTVYFKGKKISGADPASFEALSSELSRDKNDFYYNGNKLNVDIKTFEYTFEGNCLIGKDKIKSYKYGCDK